MLLTFLLSIFFISKVYANNLYTSWIISGSATYNTYKFNVLHHLTGISPYFESNSEGLSPDPPQGCTVDKAVYQVRHGPIYVNDHDYETTIEPFLQRLKKSFSTADFSRATEFAFLSSWTSPITDNEEQVSQLSKLGYLESFNLGTRLAYRYPNLLPKEKKASFKIWGSDEDRTRDSTKALFAGLFSGHETIGDVIMISESKDRGANSLTPTRTCPKFDTKASRNSANIWLSYYSVPIITRLNSKVPGFDFSPADVLAMQELCGYETLIRGSSKFCALFTPEEWLSLEYYFDIRYYYELGYGSNLSPSLGMPWIVATSHLLNQTVNSKQNLYISVAHRQMPPLLLTALGLYNDSEYITTSNKDPIIPLDKINYRRVWRSSDFITFSSQIALERLNCKSSAYFGSFVRILVNSAPKPLPKCSSGPGASCPLSQYLDYVKQRDDLFEDFSKACGLQKENVTNSLSFFFDE